MIYSSEEIASICGGEKRTNNGWDCKCPAHDDKTASLSINEDGIFYCHAGCKFDEIKAALASLNINLNGMKEKPFSTDYIYKNADNKPVYKQVRIYPKDFRTLRYESGQWLSGIGKIERVLYHLPELRAAIASGQRVAIAEGEKDADRVIKETDGRIICTTNLGGAGNWKLEYNKEFVGADLTIFYDNDKPGTERKDKLVEQLKSIVRKLTVINLPPEYKDISDFWDAGHEIADDMKEQIHIASLADFVIDAAQWLKEPETIPSQLINGIINAADKVMLIGKSKTRKSFLALQLLLSLASGKDFLGFVVPKPRKCLLVQFEIKKDNFHSRLLKMAEGLMIEPDDIFDNLKIINARGKDLDDAKIIEYAKIERFEVILFDPLYKMIEGDESKIEEVKPLLKRFDKMAEETGAAIIYVHHDKKGQAGDQDTTDRGAGSGVLGRDYDSALYLTPHKKKGLIGLESMARNHAPLDPQSLVWMEGYFAQSETPFQAKTSKDAINDRNATTMDDWTVPSETILKEGPLLVSVFLQKLNDVGCSKHMARAVMDHLVDVQKLEFVFISQKRGPPTKTVKIAT